jgi:uncharacterized protein (TIGR02679 family)
MGELPAWIADPALDGVFDRLRERLERNGLEPTGRLRLSLASRDERHAVSSLLGRSVTRELVTLDLGVLDRRLRERSGRGGLVDVLEERSGRPLRDRRREREDGRSRREEPLSLARRLLEEPSARPWAQGWAPTWVAELRRTGLLSRAADPEAVVRQAVSVLRPLFEGIAPASRVDLAAQVVGDAHALDQDRVLHRVVLRALASARELAVPETPAERRALWESFGVGPDAVSSTCLTLGLSTPGPEPMATRLRAAADAGDPVHLTRWDLRRIEGFSSPGRPLLVCENPRVLEAVAEAYAGAVPVVCTFGEPNTVVTTVLELLAAQGARLRYHGDFDWPGLAIANRAVTRFGVEPWLMSARDYEGSVRAEAPELVGPPVEPSWDAELGPVMRAHGRCLHEETVLPQLLAGLAFHPGR